MKALNMLFPLCLLFASTTSFSQDWPIHNIRTDIIGAWARAGDFNLDGKDDILVQAGDTIYWYEKHVPGWTAHIIDADFYNSEYAYVDIADIDGDGDLDVVKAPSTEGPLDSLTWNENLGNDVWEEHYIVSTSFEFATNQASLADVDGDGDLDMFMNEYEFVNQVDGGLYWLEYHEDSDSWIKHDLITGLHWFTAPGDLDGDGDTDVLSSAQGILFWMENRLPDTSWLRHDVDAENSLFGFFYAICTDIDQDGDEDLLTSIDSDGSIVYYTNPGWQKVIIVTGLANVALGQVTNLVDLDGDGDLDVTYGNYGGTPEIMGWAENPGSPVGNWTTHQILPATSSQFIPCGFGDFDEDGDWDIAALDFDFDTGKGDAFWVENPTITGISELKKANANLGVSPNPFKVQTVINYQLLEPGIMELAVFTLDGKKLAVLDSGKRSAGDYTTTWEGQPGMYILQLTLNGKFSYLKVVGTN